MKSDREFIFKLASLSLNNSEEAFANAIYITNLYSSVADTVLKANQDEILQIKLKWFLNALEEKAKTNHQDLDKVLDIQNNNNILNNFITIIEAKNISLQSNPFNTVEEVLLYVEKTECMLWQNICELYNIKNKDNLYLIKQSALVYGLLGIISNTGFYYNKGVFSLVFKNQLLSTSNYQDIYIENIHAILNKVEDILLSINKSNNKPSCKITKRLLYINDFNTYQLNQIRKDPNSLFVSYSSKVNKGILFKLILKLIFN